VLHRRLITAAVLIPLATYSIYRGGAVLLGFVAVLLTIAEVEFCQLAERDGLRPNVPMGVTLLWLLLSDAAVPQLNVLRPGLTVLLLTTLVWEMTRGWSRPLASWSATICTALYLGLCGGSIVLLRNLRPGGYWWTMTAIPSIMMADTVAYFFGRAWGRHKMAPLLSPGKTWEGYGAGVVLGTLATTLLAFIWQITTPSEFGITWLRGLLLGLAVCLLAPLGDLAVSMFKREARVKDSGRSIPGHGGALDRVDSILWAAVIGYYFVLWSVPGY
jgi:phosphatidate cytidylyltransferase